MNQVTKCKNPGFTAAMLQAGAATHWDFQAMTQQQQQDLAKGLPLPESLRLTAEQFALKLAGVK